MTSSLRHPALILATLAVMSGSLGTYAQGPAFGEAPHLGAYMMLTGVWFGLVVALGVWLWGNRSARAAATALVATWVGWESAVNLAMQLNHHWLNTIITSDAIIMCVSGMCAGALGAFATWAGVALVTPTLRQTWLALGIASAGALLGPLPLRRYLASGWHLLAKVQSTRDRREVSHSSAQGMKTPTSGGD